MNKYISAIRKLAKQQDIPQGFTPQMIQYRNRLYNSSVGRTRRRADLRAYRLPRDAYHSRYYDSQFQDFYSGRQKQPGMLYSFLINSWRNPVIDTIFPRRYSKDQLVPISIKTPLNQDIYPSKDDWMQAANRATRLHFKK